MAIILLIGRTRNDTAGGSGWWLFSKESPDGWKLYSLEVRVSKMANDGLNFHLKFKFLCL